MKPSFAFRLAWAATALLPLAAGADVIVLTNGRTIQVDRVWYEGNQVRYAKDGGVYGLPKSVVARVEQQAPVQSSQDPDVLKARERLLAGDPVEATRLLRIALARDPLSLPTLHSLVDAYLSLGDARAARQMAERAVKIDGRDARSRALLGDALAAQGDRGGAIEQYERSLLLHPDANVRRKLSEVAPPPAQAAQGAQFRLRYDGGVNEPMGVAVLKSLANAFEEHAARLGFRPDAPVTVVLQTEAAFQDGPTPPWAAGVNDGTIRVPVQGLTHPTARLIGVLRHELAHSFVAWRTRGNCPTWLHEGISQWLEGGDPARADARLTGLARSGRLPSLLTLEGPFQAVPPSELHQAYEVSLSATAYILRVKGEAGVQRLLASLGDGHPSEEALPVALSMSYSEVQKAWATHLAALDLRKEPPTSGPNGTGTIRRFGANPPQGRWSDGS